MATQRLDSGLTVACSCLFIPSSALLTGLRFYTRRRQNATLGADDWLIVPAFVLVIGMQITMIVEISKRMIGYPDPKFVPGKADATSNLALWPFELQQTLALSFIKLSVVALYRRIFNTGVRMYANWSTIAMQSIIGVWAVGFFFSFLFICRGTPENYWISAKTEVASCVKTQELHLASAVSDAILDILIILIPIPMIWHLHMSLSRKIAVTAIFSLGLITVAASVTRMVIYIQATALRYDPYLDFECGRSILALHASSDYAYLSRPDYRFDILEYDRSRPRLHSDESDRSAWSVGALVHEVRPTKPQVIAVSIEAFKNIESRD